MGARRNTVISKSWLQERKEILQKIKDQVRLYLGEESPDITRYAKSYKKDLARPWEVVPWDSVFVSLEQVNVVFGGDFHPFAQAQRSHLRVLRKMVQSRPLVVGLECLFCEDQSWVDQFLKDEISEDEFLDKTQWDRKWGFPWKHYKPLFDFAKKHGLEVLALNLHVDERSGQTLVQRDLKASEILTEKIKASPDSLFYVIYGDLHIASENLPQMLKQSFKSRADFETATIYLNSENIYFQLAEKELESKSEVIRFNDREFCILSSPPWVKWHSYLMYLEEIFDVDLEFDDDDEDEWEFQIDHTDHVSDLVKMISSALDVTVDPNAIEVYSLEDPQALVVTEKVLKKPDYNLAHALIQSDRSFYIPQEGFFYLSKATVNHAATLAGQYIHSEMCGRKELDWDFPEGFIRVIWIESMSFLLSKFVNPKRKAQTMADLKKQLEAFDKTDHGREPLLLALDQKMFELLSIYAGKARDKTFVPREKSSYVHAAKFIGEILGDRYFKLYEKQILGIDNIRALLQKSLEDKDFEIFYFEQLKSLDKLELEGSPE